MGSKIDGFLKFKKENKNWHGISHYDYNNLHSYEKLIKFFKNETN
jgi:hypothetical protein